MEGRELEMVIEVRARVDILIRDMEHFLEDRPGWDGSGRATFERYISEAKKLASSIAE